MKTTALVAAAAVAALTSAPALAQDWYVRGDVSAAFDSRLDSTPKLKGDDGWGLGLALGREYPSGFRTEAEVVHLKTDATNALADDHKTLGGFVNAYYDFNKEGALQPFVGAGLGVARVKVNGGPYHGRDTDFAYQLKAGLGYRLSDKATGEVAYRYVGAPDLKLGSGVSQAKGDFRAQAVSVGLRYRFG